MDPDEAEGPASLLFTVRVWTEGGNGREHRGCVHDVRTGAFRSFRRWSDLTAFLAGQVDEEHAVGPGENRTSNRRPATAREDDR